jgi:hypothetical protein
MKQAIEGPSTDMQKLLAIRVNTIFIKIKLGKDTIECFNLDYVESFSTHILPLYYKIAIFQK